MAKVIRAAWAKVNRGLVAGLLLCVVVAAGAAGGMDWPQWRGPNRDGVSRETDLIKRWPKHGPRPFWHVKDLGGGYSTPAIVGGKLYVVVNKGLDDELVKVLDAITGKELWSKRIGKVGNPKQRPSYPGARSTPTVEGDVLYALGSDGDLVCMETEMGEIRWRKSLRSDFGGKPGTWAYSESPLIDGDALICTPGGSEATLVAINKKTGDVLWKCAVPEGGDAAYASAIVVETGGVRQYVQLLQKGLVGVEAKTGKLLWRYGKPVSPFDANIPTPVASGDMIYVGSAGKGGGAVKLNVKDGKVEVEEVYFTAKLPTAIGGAVKIGDFLYGTTSQSMVCIEFATGEVKWQERALGAASICYADGRLYLHGENGDVAQVEPSPESYKEIARFTPPDQPKRTIKGERAWAYPVISNGLLYIRDLDSLWCYAIRNPPA